MLKCAIIGVGGLGKVHLGNVLNLEKSRGDVKLVALFDVDRSQFEKTVATNLGGESKPIDLSRFNLYTDMDEMFKKENLDFVITALPTYKHEEIAVAALERGVHVFSEKPMALTLEQCRSMLNAAKKNERLLMIGQCLRYSPVYVKLKEFTDDGRYGEVVRAEFGRFSATPTWSWDNWLLDVSRSGGAVLDMHVHDVDFIQYLFGLPHSVTSASTHYKSKFESIFTTYKYSDKIVTSACDWGMPSGYDFSETFLVRFERATVKMSDNDMTLYEEGKAGVKVEFPKEDEYLLEIDDFINCINEKRSSKINTAESCMESIRIALSEIEAAEKGSEIYL